METLTTEQLEFRIMLCNYGIVIGFTLMILSIIFYLYFKGKKECWRGHAWGKWEQYEQDVVLTKLLVPAKALYQRRRCEKCNKVEEEIV